MKIGVVNEDIWDFFHEVYQELTDKHRVRLFERQASGWSFLKARMTRQRLHRDVRAFMRENDAIFFEWGSELLALATSLPKTCGIVTRLHRYDIYEWYDKVDWRAVDVPRVSVTLGLGSGSEAPAVVIRFSGEDNLDYHHFYQLVPVEPNQRYRFTAWVATDEGSRRCSSLVQTWAITSSLQKTLQGRAVSTSGCPTSAS